jgi:DNA polymerase-4
VEELYMVGRATAPKLRQMGIVTVGDLARTDPAILKYRFKSFGQVLWDYANGIEATDVRPVGPAVKGIGNSTTTAFNVEDYHHADLVLLSLTESVAARLRQGGWCAGLVAVSCRNTDFVNVSRQRTLAEPTDSTDALFREVRKLFRELWDGKPLRHLGIRTSRLVAAEGLQYSFFDEDAGRRQALDRTIDELRNRFGKRSVQRGVFLNSGVRPVTGGVGDDEYQMMASLL